MNFLHPWAIVIGLLGMALPLVVHYMTRPRPKSMPLSTIRFVRDAVKQRQSRSKLRDGLVLLCRSCLLYTSPSPRDRQKSRMPSSA